MVSVTVDLDDARADELRALAASVGLSLKEIVEDLLPRGTTRVDATIGLLRSRRVSFGRAVELSQISAADFVEELRKRDLPVIDFPIDQLAHEHW